MSFGSANHWTASEELELLNCETVPMVRAFATRQGRSFDACMTRKCALLNGKRNRTGHEKAKQSNAELFSPPYQRSEAFKHRDEAFVRAVVAEGVRLGLVKVTNAEMVG